MSRPCLAAAALVLGVTLSGCFHVSSVISVRADGSASVRDSVAFSGLMALAMAESQGDKNGGAPVFSRSQAEARAEALGDGVELARFEELDAGYVAVYHAADVRRLRYQPPDLGEGNDAPTGGEMALAFAFETGDPATVRVIVQKPTPSKRPPPGLADDPPDLSGAAEALGEMGSLFGDARMTVSLRVEGEVVETTAAYADGSEMTLFDLPFAAVFESADVLAQMDGGLAGSDAYALLDGIDGVRIQRPGTVRVRFR